jgi:hypothetical protein
VKNIRAKAQRREGAFLIYSAWCDVVSCFAGLMLLLLLLRWVAGQTFEAILVSGFGKPYLCIITYNAT